MLLKDGKFFYLNFTDTHTHQNEKFSYLFNFIILKIPCRTRSRTIKWKFWFAYLDLIRMRRGREGERGVIVLLNCQIMNSHCECVCQLGRRKLFMRVYISLFHLDSYHPPSSCLSTIFVGVSGKNLFSRKVIPIYFYTTLSHWM